jgi:hypothetical protein
MEFFKMLKMKDTLQATAIQMLLFKREAVEAGR